MNVAVYTNAYAIRSVTQNVILGRIREPGQMISGKNDDVSQIR